MVRAAWREPLDRARLGEPTLRRVGGVLLVYGQETRQAAQEAGCQSQAALEDIGARRENRRADRSRSQSQPAGCRSWSTCQVHAGAPFEVHRLQGKRRKGGELIFLR